MYCIIMQHELRVQLLYFTENDQSLLSRGLVESKIRGKSEEKTKKGIKGIKGGESHLAEGKISRGRNAGS